LLNLTIIEAENCRFFEKIMRNKNLKMIYELKSPTKKAVQEFELLLKN